MYILDTDFIIALRFPLESTHDRAVNWTRQFLTESEGLVTSLVEMECATVISRKYSQIQAIQTIQALHQSPSATIYLDRDDTIKTWELFAQQNKRSTSVVDCANVVVAKKMGCQIMSFDSFYRKFNLLAGVKS